MQSKNKLQTLVQIVQGWNRWGRSPHLQGAAIVLLSSLILSFQNIVVRIVLSQQTVLGISFGGFVESSVGNLLLILLMRMVVVVLLMAFGIGTWIYPPLWKDIQNRLNERNPALIGGVLASGFLLFLSLPLMFTALSVIPAGIATTLFFIYPTVTVLFAWWCFGDRPTFLLTLAVGTIYAGCLLTIPGSEQSTDKVWLGATMAALAGVVFAAYTILTQICTRRFRLHPVPFTLGVFVIMLLLASLTVGAIAFIPWLTATLPSLRIVVNATMWSRLWASTVVLALTAIAGFLLNNIGIRRVGAAQAAIISASGPVFTTLLGWLLIQETLQDKAQAIGILLVTIWVGAIGTGAMNRDSRNQSS
ncbi:EamA family transporter [Leptolyngbya sp. FACHB-541]|uniref:DMT family transporter n=1 Tax=Leptolyngbya sp. FACHB-541 TaxID=2692810 RepID=UPI0016896A5D|nr:DMT family transporter [Leptolyngbya sp. FACHB-541]MBD1995767.1 EamA family transporter [Leptolyngbya sp. FACHB-541]